MVNGSAFPGVTSEKVKGKIDGIAAGIDGALNAGKLIGQPRDGFILMIVPAPKNGGPPRVSEYASSVAPLAVAYVIRDQLEKFEATIPELRRRPVGWMKATKEPNTADSYGEWNVDFSFGDDQPDGEGWRPLYG